jgi:hypothetical protein
VRGSSWVGDKTRSEESADRCKHSLSGSRARGLAPAAASPGMLGKGKEQTLAQVQALGLALALVEAGDGVCKDKTHGCAGQRANGSRPGSPQATYCRHPACSTQQPHAPCTRCSLHSHSLLAGSSSHSAARRLACLHRLARGSAAHAHKNHIPDLARPHCDPTRRGPPAALFTRLRQNICCTAGIPPSSWRVLCAPCLGCTRLSMSLDPCHSSGPSYRIPHVHLTRPIGPSRAATQQPR